VKDLMRDEETGNRAANVHAPTAQYRLFESN